MSVDRLRISMKIALDEVELSRRFRERTAPRAVPVCTHSDGSVLVVEDDEDAAAVACAYLRHAALHCVRVAHTLGDAFEALSGPTPILAAIVDRSLPDGTSEILVETIKRRDIPVIVVSGTMPPDVRELAGVARLVKGDPEDMNRLQEWIGHIAAGRKS